MRLKLVLLISASLALLSTALVTVATLDAARRASALKRQTAADAAALLGRSIAQSLRQTLSLARTALEKSSDERHIVATDPLVSTVVLKWTKDDFAYHRRLDNPSFLAEHKLAAHQIEDALAMLHNDIANAGAGQEQLYAAALGPDSPVLIAIGPLNAEAENEPGPSIAAIIDARPVWSLLGETTDTRSFMVDRFGTVLLHAEQDRATHRETMARHPIVRRFFESVGEKEDIEFAEPGNQTTRHGSFARVSFAGSAIISEWTRDTDLTSTHGLRAKLILTAVATATAILLVVFGVMMAAPPAREKKKPAAARLAS